MPLVWKLFTESERPKANYLLSLGTTTTKTLGTKKTLSDTLKQFLKLSKLTKASCSNPS